MQSELRSRHNRTGFYHYGSANHEYQETIFSTMQKVVLKTRVVAHTQAGISSVSDPQYAVSDSVDELSGKPAVYRSLHGRTFELVMGKVPNFVLCDLMMDIEHGHLLDWPVDRIMNT